MGEDGIGDGLTSCRANLRSMHEGADTIGTGTCAGDQDEGFLGRDIRALAHGLASPQSIMAIGSPIRAPRVWPAGLARNVYSQGAGERIGAVLW